MVGWKLNPLEWESKIEFNIKNNKIKIKYLTDGIYITPVAFSNLYNNFINNFIDNLLSNKSYKTENDQIINSAKKRVLLFSFVFFFIGVLIILLSNYVTTIIKNRLVGLLFIGASIYASEKLINGYLVKKHKDS
ncbi:MAG: hypothetical protein HC798_01835 [Polaribacter sp.]|nr:hypothetical protein [Polaribacter sp.]